MQRSKWIDRRFTFDCPEGWLPNILERLRGTHPRLLRLIRGLPAQKLTEKTPDGGWSIQEHIGHLLDLEALHEGRIDDFLARKPLLRPADMRNAQTDAANHNAAAARVLLKKFKKARDRFVRRLEQLDDDTQRFRSTHPRLHTPMRPVDLAFFTAEHDDHHLATIRQLLSAG